MDKKFQPTRNLLLAALDAMRQDARDDPPRAAESPPRVIIIPMDLGRRLRGSITLLPGGMIGRNLCRPIC